MLPRVISRDKIQKVKHEVFVVSLSLFLALHPSPFLLLGKTGGDAFCVFFFAGERDDTNLPSFSAARKLRESFASLCGCFQK